MNQSIKQPRQSIEQVKSIQRGTNNKHVFHNGIPIHSAHGGEKGCIWTKSIALRNNISITTTNT